jgi:hypothetical protein
MSVLPDFCAVSVVSFADALGLKYICAPLAPVLLLGLLIGRLLPIKELSFEPLKCWPCSERESAENNQANNEWSCRVTRSAHCSYHSVCTNHQVSGPTHLILQPNKGNPATMGEAISHRRHIRRQATHRCLARQHHVPGQDSRQDTCPCSW